MGKEKTPILAYVSSLILTIVVIAFTWVGLFSPQDCNGIDKIYFYCYLHPMSGIDIIGLVLFYVGYAYNLWLWLTKWNAWFESKLLNAAGVLAMIGSVILMWAL